MFSKRKTVNHKSISSRLLTVIITTALAVASAGSWATYAILIPNKTEPEAEFVETNTDAVLHASQRRLAKSLKWRFSDLRAPLISTAIIPGLRSTRTTVGKLHAITTCTSMTPQGMAVTEDYIFVSAYCHTHEHNSVIYMLNRHTHDFIKEIVLPNRAHVGGMAYDPIHRNVWVSGGTSGAAKAVAYPLKTLEKYDLDADSSPVKATYSYTLASIDRNSYMTYNNNSLMIGYFATDGESTLQRFDITERGGLQSQIIADYDEVHESVTADFLATTSKWIQGVAASGDKIVLSSSYGILDSELQVYSNANPDGDDNFTRSNALHVIRFPRMMEQIYIFGDKLYCLFESAAYAYRRYPGERMDRILIIDLDWVWGDGS